jgi:hypothetical protein
MPPEASSVPPFSSLQVSAVFSVPASQVLEQAAFPQEAQAAAAAAARLPEESAAEEPVGWVRDDCSAALQADDRSVPAVESDESAPDDFVQDDWPAGSVPADCSAALTAGDHSVPAAQSDELAPDGFAQDDWPAGSVPADSVPADYSVALTAGDHSVPAAAQSDESAPDGFAQDDCWAGWAPVGYSSQAYPALADLAEGGSVSSNLHLAALQEKAGCPDDFPEHSPLVCSVCRHLAGWADCRDEPCLESLVFPEALP